uniref:Uncharacterized protein n=1 Tax=Plectus sambesii TaxID=2011161 RepID=A0A914W4P1_9BILA
MCFFWPRGLELFFNSVTVHIVSLLPWMFGITIGLMTDLSNCPKVFDECRLVYLYECKSPVMPGQVSALLGILQVFGYCGPILMTIGYVAIFVHLRKLRQGSYLSDKQKKNFTREVNLLKQVTGDHNNAVCDRMAEESVQLVEFLKTAVGPERRQVGHDTDDCLRPVVAARGQPCPCHAQPSRLPFSSPLSLFFSIASSTSPSVSALFQPHCNFKTIFKALCLSLTSPA